jgi:NAD(P)-dependent dehydrogenase (short-subunit alcohol dehydrogenase family)
MSDSQVDSVSKVEFPQASPDSPLKGQNALVTGASYGIGAQIGAHLAAQGVNIAITARSKDKTGEARHGATQAVRSNRRRHSRRPHEGAGQRQHSSRGNARVG